MTAVRRPGPERWQVDAGEADIAVLTVPPVLRRERLFDLDLQFRVKLPAADAPPGEPWLAVTLEIDGRREWTRRIDARGPGDTDVLDFHCRRALPGGRALRLRAVTQVGGGAKRQRLVLSAEAAGDD